MFHTLQIAEVWKRADEFFALNTDVKTKYRRLEDDDKKYGWEPLASEKYGTIIL